MDNIFCAFDGKSPVAMICMKTEDCPKWDKDAWRKLLDSVDTGCPALFHYVENNYFLPLDAEDMSGKTYILAVSVLPQYRRKGIGSELLNWFVSMHSCDALVLDTLIENEAALALYKQAGFVIEGEYEGYSSGADKPKCFRMMRKTT